MENLSTNQTTVNNTNIVNTKHVKNKDINNRFIIYHQNIRGLKGKLNEFILNDKHFTSNTSYFILCCAGLHVSVFIDHHQARL